ncbi:MAG: LysR family glycine cleavage system transcriptional activator [Arenicella sp.]|jgi:LysR family glycine cleavage system transcriptional activator
MRIKPLPPLKSAVAFEAAARHLSFKQAAEELCVTQGAVSKQVRLLEQFLQQALFTREKRMLELTNSGMRYYQDIRATLLGLATATEEMVKWRDQSHITIATTSAVASFWLLPKFAQYQKRHPNIEVRIRVVRSINQIRQSDFDLGVFFCNDTPPNFDSIELFNEEVFPVCSPNFLASHPEIKKAENLSSSKLLVLDTKEAWINWNDWLNGCGLGGINKSASQIEINDYPLLIQAALNGQGIALAWHTLIDKYIADGSMVAPITARLRTESKFYLIRQLAANSNPEIEKFAKFLSTSNFLAT